MQKPKRLLDEPQYLFDKPGNVAKVLRILYILCAALFALDFVVHRHIETGFERLPAFYAIYGFIACVLLVLIAKEMRKVVMRSEDYYEKHKN